MTIKSGPLVRKVACKSERQPLEALFTLTECVGTVFVNVLNILGTFVSVERRLSSCARWESVGRWDPGWVRALVSLPILLKIHLVCNLK